MGLSASMWTSVSGLLAHGERMNVIGNNIANVNTVGFKGSRMDFEDFMSQSIGTAAGMGQMGRGVRVGIIMGDFSQATFETTNNTTDIGIEGNGFFAVRPPSQTGNYYTRAGNFQWNKDGYLTDPHGYVLQGWKVDNAARNQSSSGSSATTGSSLVGSGVPVDIKLDSFTCPPKHTTAMTIAMNLDSAPGNDKSIDEDNPFFSLLNNWDATPDADGKITPLGKNAYAWPYTMNVFDEGGQAHKITIYFDRVAQTNDTNIDGMNQNDVHWEYIVTMEPAEDLRNFTDPPVPAGEVPEKYKGLLMSGTLTFDSSGQMKDMSAYVPTSQNMDDMSTWVQAPLSSDGMPLFAPNFTGRDGASSAWNPTQSQINQNADGRLIELNLGLRSTNSSWGGNAPSTIAGWVQPTGDNKAYKSDKKAGSLVEVQDAVGATVYGVVGADGKVYVPKALPATIPSEAENPAYPGIVFKQKNTSDYTAGKGEAVGAGGWIYKQEELAYDGGTYPAWLGSDGITYVYNASTGLYCDSTAALPAPWGALPGGVTVTAIADATSPIPSSEAVGTGVPRYKYDNTGALIPETVTRAYNGMGTNVEHLDPSCTSFKGTGTNFTEKFKSQDGYTFGDLQYTNVNTDGVLTGRYSNGVTLELFQITLYDFPSLQNLRREGGNLFSETRESGIPTSGAPGTGVFGTTAQNSLEQSNVDIGREFVNMITTQRGYQANSKAITTVDTMLETVISMKR